MKLSLRTQRLNTSHCTPDLQGHALGADATPQARVREGVPFQMEFTLTKLLAPNDGSWPMDSRFWTSRVVNWVGSLPCMRSLKAR